MALVGFIKALALVGEELLYMISANRDRSSVQHVITVARSHDHWADGDVTRLIASIARVPPVVVNRLCLAQVDRQALPVRVVVFAEDQLEASSSSKRMVGVASVLFKMMSCPAQAQPEAFGFGR